MIKADVLENGSILIGEKTVSDSVKFETMAFSFPDSWKGFYKTAVFRNGDTVINVIIDKDSEYCLSDSECYIPNEVIKPPYFTVSVFGVQNERLATTARGSVKVVASGYEEGDEPSTPTADQYSQLLTLANNTKAIAESVKNTAESGGFDGKDGYTPIKGVDYFTEEDKQELIDQSYTPESSKAQSGVAVAEGFDQNVGDINGALALVVEGSANIPPSILDRLSGEVGAEAVERLRPYAETVITNKFNQMADNLGLNKAFKTTVKQMEAGGMSLTPNTVYGVVLADNANDCTVSVYNTDGTLNAITGKMIGVVMGNYGDTLDDRADAFVAGYKDLSVSRGIYIGKTAELTGEISWGGKAFVVTITLNNTGE